MPDSWAKAFAPTMALLGCTGKPVMLETRREQAMIWVVSSVVSQGKTS